jgi:hypothetical protein
VSARGRAAAQIAVAGLLPAAAAARAQPSGAVADQAAG